MSTNELKPLIEQIAIELARISRGGPEQPLGLEAVTMALGGQGYPGQSSVAGGLSNVASAINDLRIYDGLTEVASSIQSLADAIRESAHKNNPRTSLAQITD